MAAGSHSTRMESISASMVSLVHTVERLKQLTTVQTALPFLARTELLLSPLLPLFTAYIISLLGFNVAKNALGVYFKS